MSYFQSRDYNLAVARGNVSGVSMVGKFGNNPSIASGATEAITFSGAISWLTAATTVRVKAGGNAADTAAGAGAQQITIVGLDSSWNEVSETVATAGASASAATTATFIRVYRAYVGNVGTYTVSNTGNVTIENSAGGTDLITIQAARGQTQTTQYTVPLGKTAYLTSIFANVDSSKSCDLFMYQRQNADDVTTPFQGVRLITSFPGLLGTAVRNLQSYPSFPAKTDLWFTAENSVGAVSAVGVRYELFLV